MVQKESGNGKLPENRPVRRQKRRADASGQKKSDQTIIWMRDRNVQRQESERQRDKTEDS